MRKKWTKLISLLCVTALLAGLLVVPAAAANDPKNILNFHDQTEKRPTTVGIFTCVCSADLKTDITGTGTSHDKVSLTLDKYSKFDSSASISFTAPDNGSLLVYASVATASDAEKGSLELVGTTTVAQDCHSATPIAVEFTGLTKGTSYKLTRNNTSGKKAMAVFYLEFIPAVSSEALSQDQLNALKSTVEAGLADYTVTQEEINTQEAAASAVKEKVEGLVNNSTVTVELAEESFTAAEAAQKGVDGKNGSYTFKVVLKSGSLNNVTTAECTMTITATPYSNRATEVKLTGAPTGEKKVNDTIELTADVTYEHAEDEATETLKWTSSNPNVVALSEGSDDQTTVTVTAKAIGKATITVADGAGEDAKSASCEIQVTGPDQTGIYTFESNKMGTYDSSVTASGGVKYDNHFSAVGEYKVHTTNTSFSDGYSSTVRFSSNGTAKAERAMVVKIDKVADVNVWWETGKADTSRTLHFFDNASYSQKGDATTTTQITEFKDVPAGTYYMGGSTDDDSAGAVYIYKVVVTEEGAVPAPTDINDKTVTIEDGTGTDGAPKVGDTLTAKVDGIEDTSDLTFTWTVGGVAASSKTNTYEVQEADAGKEITVYAEGDGEKYTGKTATATATVKASSTTPDEKTPAPVFDTDTDTDGANYNLVKKDLTSGHVEFTLKAAPAEGTTYKLYAKDGDGTPLTGTVEETTLSFTIDTTKLPTPDKTTATFNVTATETGKDESEPAEVTVTYVLVNKVEFVHSLHVIYEGGDGEMGGPENPGADADRPSQWQLVANVTPSDATDPQIAFSIDADHQAFATVDATSGIVTAKKEGTATVTATTVNNGADEKSATCQIDVMPYIASVTIDRKDFTMNMGDAAVTLKATVKDKAGADSDYQNVTWSVDEDNGVVNVGEDGKVTPLKAGTAVVRATSQADSEILRIEKEFAQEHDNKLLPTRKPVSATVTIEVKVGKPTLTVEVDPDEMDSNGGEVTIAVTEKPAPTGADVSLTCDKEGVKLTKQDGENVWTATLPANTTTDEVTYTFTAKSDAVTDKWLASEPATTTATVHGTATKAITARRAPNVNATTALTEGATLNLAVVASITKDSGDLVYSWTKDTEVTEVLSKTDAYTKENVTEADAGTYTCTISSTDKTVKAQTVKFTVTVTKSDVTAINVELTPANNVTLEEDTLTITGQTTANLTVTTTPAGHPVTASLNNIPLATMTYADGKLTVTPKRASTDGEEATITLKSGGVTKTIKLVVNKLSAPAPMTEDQVTVTQPTAEVATGSIQINDPVEGTTYLYSATNDPDWHEFTVKDGKVIAEGLAPATYEVRVRVNANFQNITPNPLKVVIKAFEAPTPEKPNTAKLQAAIDAAEAKLEGVVASADGKDVTSDKTWATQSAIDTLKAAIETAKAALTAETQEAVDAAEAALKVATEDFKPATGGKTDTPVTPEKPNTAALQAAIDAAEAKLEGVVASADGKDVPTDKTWATQSAIDALQTAIATAKAALTAETQEAVDAAEAAIKAATEDFKPATGGKTDTPVTPEKPDTTALQAAIDAATAKLVGVVASEDGTDVATDKTWATQSAIDALQTAIATAKVALNAGTQAEVDAAVAALNTAAAAFTPATGSKTDDEPDTPDEPVAVTGVILTGRNTVQVGETITLTANVQPDNATDKHVTWTSSDESILTVSDGVVTGVKAGKATVTATTDNGGFSDSLEITVTAKTGGVATGTHTGGSTTSTGTHTQTTAPGSQTDVNENGDKVTTVTSTAGGKTVTVTDEAGEVVAKVVIPAQTPDLAYKFEDVPAGHWAEAAINAMAAMNVVQGVSQTQHIFDMDSAITRGAMAQMLFNLSQGKDGMTGNFTDTQGSWCADAVAWAAAAGVVNGLSETVFAPDQAITREQLATMLYRYAKLLDLDVSATADLSRFVDAGEVDSWASEAMTWAVAAGLLQGKGAGDLDPTAAASRAETATIMSRFLKLI